MVIRNNTCHTHRDSTTQSRALPRRTRLLQSEVSRPVLWARVSSSNKALRSKQTHETVPRGGKRWGRAASSHTSYVYILYIPCNIHPRIATRSSGFSNEPSLVSDYPRPTRCHPRISSSRLSSLHQRLITLPRTPPSHISFLIINRSSGSVATIFDLARRPLPPLTNVWLRVSRLHL